MDNNFEILKNIENEELYSKTYITYNNLENIKNKNFGAFSRYKFNGFIEILSKRLNLNLDDLRDEANSYFDKLEPKTLTKDQEPESDMLSMIVNKKVAIIIGSIIFILTISLAIFIALDSNKQEEIYPPIEPAIQELPTPIEPIQSTDINSTKSIDNKAINTDIKIIPTRKIWIGIINLDTKEKQDYSTSDELVIDKSKNQIIVINGAYLSLMIGDVEKKYDADKRIRFICKDGKIEEISYEHFKSLNNGKAWN